MRDQIHKRVDDSREAPTYSIVEAAHYLRIPVATLRSWVVGTSYPVRSGKRLFRPLIAIADRKTPALSFINLVEVHVLDAVRRDHHIPLQKVRILLDYLQTKFPSRHPLADNALETDGLDLFVRRYDQLISQSGQSFMREALCAYLRRIERDSSGMPVRLYPFTRKRQLEEPRSVVIDPSLSFGRPVLARTGIATAVIAERYKAGESINDLARDYRRKGYEIEEAIRCELQVEAA